MKVTIVIYKDEDEIVDCIIGSKAKAMRVMVKTFIRDGLTDVFDGSYTIAMVKKEIAETFKFVEIEARRS